MARYVSSKEHLIILMNLLRVRFILHFKVDAQPLELLVLCVPECAVPLQNLSLLFVHTVRIKAKLFKQRLSTSSRYNISQLLPCLHTYCCSVVNFYFHWLILIQNACRHQLFVVNKEKPSEITCILHANRNKLLRFLKDFSAVDKGKSEPRLYCFSAFSEPNHVREY